MHAYDGGAIVDRAQMRRDRATDALVGRGGRYRVDEPLARRADEERQTERLQLRQPGDGSHALLGRLAEADAGIGHDGVARNAGAAGDVERAEEKRLDVG